MSIGDLLVQGMQGLQGPNPRPNPMPNPGPQTGPGGASPGPGAPAPPQGPGLPPAQAYGPDPSTAASIQALMQMHEQDRRANAVDRGLAGMAASFGPLETRNAIMNSAQPQDDRVGAMAEAMPIVQQQQMAASAPLMAQSLGLDPKVAATLPPAALYKLWMDKEQGGITAQTDLTKQKNTDLLEAQQKVPDQINKMTEMNTGIDTITGAVDDDGKTPALQNILNSSTKKAAAMQLMSAKEGESGYTQLWDSAWASVLTPQEKAVVARMKQLSAQSYGDAFMSTGSRRTQTEVAALRAGLNQIGNFNQPYDDYVNSLNTYKTQLNKGMANALGAAGRLDEVPENQRGLVNSEYLPAGFDKDGKQIRPAGPLYAGQGGTWASQPGFASAPASNATSPGGPSAAPATVQTPDDVAKLPKGTPFVVPSGPHKGETRYAT